MEDLRKCCGGNGYLLASGVALEVSKKRYAAFWAQERERVLAMTSPKLSKKSKARRPSVAEKPTTRNIF